jgi:DNA adenine methylase
MAAFEGLARKVVLVEIDPQVASVWKTILCGDGKWLAGRILRFKVSAGSVNRVLTGPKSSLRERAFATLLRNRVQRAGILAPAAGLMKKGEDGKGLRSRWYPETLSERVLRIANKRKRIRFIQGDGIEFLREYHVPERAALFLDPPYTVAGKRLYEYSDVDHQTLFAVARQFAGKVLMTYNNVSAIRTIAEEFGFQTRVVRMKNSHNRMKKELLISDSMEWFL